MPDGLKYQLCDVWGNPIRTFNQFTGGTIENEIHALRTAKLVAPMSDPLTLNLFPLMRILRAYVPHVDLPVFAGPLIIPSFDFTEGTVEVNAVGTEFRLQRAFLHTPLEVTARDCGEAMWDLIARAVNRPYPPGAPPLGIIRDTVEATFPIDRTWEAGQNIWDAVMELAELGGAPDVVFQPVDSTDGYHVRFKALARLGVDRTADVRLEYGWGRHTAAEFKYEPSGDVVNNQFTSVGPAPDDGSFSQAAYTANHWESETGVGIYEGYDANDADSDAVQEAKAMEMVAAYHDPPDYYTVTPAYEGAPDPPARGWGVPPAFGAEYDVGDVIGTVAKKYGHVRDIPGRVRKSTINQVDTNGGWRVDLECAPNVDPSGVV